MVFAGLQIVPFQGLDSVELNILSFETALLVGLTSVKRFGDLQALSVKE